MAKREPASGEPMTSPAETPALAAEPLGLLAVRLLAAAKGAGGRGLLHVARALGCAPAECVYVGDRADVDAVAATRAGMRSILVGEYPRARAGGTECVVTDFRELHRLFDATSLPPRG